MNTEHHPQQVYDYRRSLVHCLDKEIESHVNVIGESLSLMLKAVGHEAQQRQQGN